MAEVIYLELSYKIIGLAFRVFNELGYGMNEKHYQKAFVKELEQEGINFEREKPVIINYKDKTIGKYFLDFVIDNKIIVELKIRPRIGYTHIKQVFSDLRTTGYKLAILIYFTREGVKYRRVLNSL